ncbi:SPW repeat domain-containing protein [Paenibacillus sp. y28]|uniref:SPW repeat domain-containing protein n=1 Tax=Paenibacillus sp. y28 TaxID=3129110 RepID=UPI0030165A77
MTVKNVCSALIGVWLAFTPWLFDFTDHRSALLTCVLMGAIQCVCSLLAIGRSGRTSWPNWLALLMGVSFLIFPHVFDIAVSLFFLHIIFGFITIVLNFCSLFPEYQ